MASRRELEIMKRHSNIWHVAAFILCVFLPVVAAAQFQEPIISLERDARGQVVMLHVENPQPPAPDRDGFAQDPVIISDNFVAGNISAFGVRDGISSLIVKDVSSDNLGMTHVKYQQMRNGVAVLGGEVHVHLNQNLSPVAMNGRVSELNVAAPNAAFNPTEAKQRIILAWQAKHQTGAVPAVNTPSLIVFRLPNVSGEGRLAYRATASFANGEVIEAADDVIIDAVTGATLKIYARDYQGAPIYRQIYDCNTYPATCMMNVWRSQYQYYFGRSEPYTTDRGSHPIPGIFFGSDDVDNLYDYAGQAHSYYQTKFGRDGGNGVGGIGTGRSGEVGTAYTRGLVHLDDAWSSCPGQAGFAHTGKLQFCAGMALLDVSGHEYAHSIVYFSFRDPDGYPTGATYEGETGALNEAWADLAGEALEQQTAGTHNWRMGDSFAPDGTSVIASSGVIRDLANPGSITDEMHGLPQPYPDRFYSENVHCGPEDNLGVHHNSTVASRSMHLAAEGGTFNGCTIAPIGMDAVERIWYRGWTELFTSTETFNGAYALLNQACLDLYGDSKPQWCESFKKAMQAVEMDQAGFCYKDSHPRVRPACAPVLQPSFKPVSANGQAKTVFAVGEQAYAAGADLTANAMMVIYITDANMPLKISESIIPAPGSAPVVVTVNSNGYFLRPVFKPKVTGKFKVVLDTNKNGKYESTDMTASFDVKLATTATSTCADCAIKLKDGEVSTISKIGS